jgi:hypothetical protein
MRHTLVLAFLLVGCSTGTTIVEVQLEADPSGGFITLHAGGAGVDPTRPFASGATPIALTDVEQRVCWTIHGPPGDVNLRMARCDNETCTGPSDSIPRVHSATITDAIYAGKTTNVRLGPWRLDTHSNVDRCDVRGCVDRFAATFCRVEDGAHFCEFMGSVEPTPECDTLQTSEL